MKKPNASVIIVIIAAIICLVSIVAIIICLTAKGNGCAPLPVECKSDAVGSNVERWV